MTAELSEYIKKEDIKIAIKEVIKEDPSLFLSREERTVARIIIQREIKRTKIKEKFFMSAVGAIAVVLVSGIVSVLVYFGQHAMDYIRFNK